MYIYIITEYTDVTTYIFTQHLCHVRSYLKLSTTSLNSAFFYFSTFTRKALVLINCRMLIYH